MLGTAPIVLFVLALFGALPAWPHSNRWGYFLSAGVGVVLLVLVVLRPTGTL